MERKILILEDNHDRINTFKEKFKKDDVYFFDNVQEAIKAYDLFAPFDVIFLDHDLDNEIYVPSGDPNTGYQFAKFLETKESLPQIIIHSMNVVGAKNIKNILPDAEIVPFPVLKRFII